MFSQIPSPLKPDPNFHPGTKTERFFRGSEGGGGGMMNTQGARMEKFPGEKKGCLLSTRSISEPLLSPPLPPKIVGDETPPPTRARLAERQSSPRNHALVFREGGNDDDLSNTLFL